MRERKAERKKEKERYAVSRGTLIRAGGSTSYGNEEYIVLQKVFAKNHFL